MASNTSRCTLATCLAVGTAIAVPAGPANADDPVRRTFDAGPGARLVVDTDFGAVDIQSRDRNGIEVVVERPESLELEFEQTDGVVTIRGRRDAPRWRFWDWERQPKFRISVPYQHDVELRTAGGDIAINRLQGDVVARTSGGDVRIGEVDGPVQAKTSGGSVRISSAHETVAQTSGGDIRIGDAQGPVSATTSGGSIETEAVAGDVAAKTSGGSIRVRGVNGAVQAKTSGGSISAEFIAQPNAPSELRTSGGNVTVYLPDEIAVDLKARTSGGRVSTDFPVTMVGEKSASNRLETALNGGGPAMALRTSGGSIRLRRLEQ